MERIGRYELRDKLGQGGMGVVYRAFDTLLQRIVAVKVISATIDANTDLRERFFREARAAGQLSHRNIITIHDLGEDDGVPYLAMEYLEGEDLQRRMAGHDRMSLSHKLDLAIEVCQGLEFAHNHNVVHRDIKPANIFITDNGTVKLLDFGLARLVTSELTHSNMMMGTLNYMAPEQVRGERADHRSDIFATGVVLYELLSGRKAFQGDSFAATLYKILQEVPEPLDQIDSTLPWQMVAIVERALAKPRDERYQQMSEMLRDLFTVRQQQQFSDSPTGYRSVTGEFPSPLPQPAPAATAQRPGSGGQRPPSGGQRPPSGGQRPPSGGQRPPSGSQRPASGDQRPISEGIRSATDDDVTGQYNPPMVTPVPTPAPAPLAPASRSPRAVVVVVILATLAVAVGGPITYSLWPRQTPTSPAQAPPVSAVTSDDPAIQTAVKQSLNAFQIGDYAGAARYADSVLLQIPNHPEARRIAERAREAAETIDRGLRDARSLFDAGRYDDAAEAAGSVLERLTVECGRETHHGREFLQVARPDGRRRARADGAGQVGRGGRRGTEAGGQFLWIGDRGRTSGRAIAEGRARPGCHRQVLRGSRPLPKLRDRGADRRRHDWPASGGSDRTAGHRTSCARADGAAGDGTRRESHVPVASRHASREGSRSSAGATARSADAASGGARAGLSSGYLITAGPGPGSGGCGSERGCRVGDPGPAVAV